MAFANPTPGLLSFAETPHKVIKSKQNTPVITAGRWVAGLGLLYFFYFLSLPDVLQKCFPPRLVKVNK